MMSLSEYIITMFLMIGFNFTATYWLTRMRAEIQETGNGPLPEGIKQQKISWIKRRYKRRLFLLAVLFFGVFTLITILMEKHRPA